jgi:putative inorganic carbon (HCO3(-)) transporter
MIGNSRRAVLQTGTQPRTAADTLSLRDLQDPRVALMCLLLLTYVWRFHDLNSLVAVLRLSAVGTFMSWGFLAFGRKPAYLRHIRGHPVLTLLIVGVVWVGVTVPFALMPALAWEAWWGVHFRTLTMSLFVLTCLTSIISIKRAMAVHVFGAAVLAFYYAKGGFPLWGTPVPMYDVNDLALHLNMALPFAVYFAVRADKRWLRNTCWFVIGLMTVSVLMTQSRGGFLTVGVFAALTIIYSSHVRWWMRVVPPILVVCTYMLAPPATKARLSTLFSPTEDYNMHDEEGRIEIWKRGIGYMLDNPISGVGMTNFPVAEATLSSGVRASVTHNSFLEVGAETGFPGLLLFVSMIGGAMVMLGRTRARLRRHLGQSSRGKDLTFMAESLLLSLLAYCIGGFFLSLGYLPMLYSVIVISIGFCYWANVALRTDAAPTQPRQRAYQAPAFPIRRRAIVR